MRKRNPSHRILEKTMFHQFTRPLSVFSAVLKRMKEAVSIQRLRGLRLASTAQMLAMIVLAGAIGTQSFYAKAQTPTLMRFPNTFGDKIVFEAHDNLWMGSLKGGVVAQLTHGLSHDLLPRFSPDGKWIAFTRINQGTEDVYVLPAEGGEPRRLTFRSSRAGGPGPTFSADDNLVVTWTLDSAAIIFLARRQAFNWSDLSLYSVPVTGGLPSLLPLHPAGWMSYEPNSHTVAFTRSFTSFQSRKRYQGGLATDLFTYDSDTKHLVQLTHWKGMDDLPMWAGHKIYFLSDRGPLHRANIWVHDLQTNTEHQVTHFADYDVDMPSLGRGSLSFQQGGSLFTLSLPEETLHRIQLTVPDDGAQTGDRVVRTEPMFQDTDHGGTNFTVSSKGDFAVLSARGDLFRLSGGGSSAVNLTGTSDVSEDHPVISPDGVLVAYLTDRSGEQQVALLPAGGGREQILSHYRNGLLHTPTWSPDGKALLVANSKNQLLWLPLDGTAPRTIAEDRDGPILDGAFSPDSNSIAYSTTGSTGQHSLHIYDLKASKEHNLASSQSSDHDPVFSADGHALFFLSDRNSLVLRSNAETNFATLKSSSLYVTTLFRDETFSLTQSGTDTSSGSRSSSRDYDLEHAMDRVLPLTTKPADVSWIGASQGSVFYLTSPARTTGEDLPGDVAALHRFNLTSKKDEVLAEDVGAVGLGSGSGALLYKQHGRWLILRNASGPPEEIPLDRMEASIKPREEWGEIFRQTARYQTVLFFDANMDGTDWGRITHHYAGLLPLVGSRDDLNYLLTEMIGELASSHIFLYGAEDLSHAVPKAALLGADYAVDPASGRYRIATIYPGDNSRPHYRSPLTVPGQTVQAGEFLLAINGKELLSPASPDELLVGVSGSVSLTIATSASGPRRTVQVTPLRSEFAVREAVWVQDHQNMAAVLSAGKVGYIYLSDFSDYGTEQFLRQFHSQTDKQALVVDIRWNGGGDTSQWVLERLRRTLQGGFRRRNGSVDTLPDGLLSGPKVCITNASTASDGDQFAYYFKLDRLGSVFGERTWGGVRGVGSGFTLLDGSSVTIPHDALFDAHGKWIIENQGVAPDKTVLEMPEDNALHRDRVFHDAVTFLGTTLPSASPRSPVPSTLPAYPPLGRPGFAH
jgi:tricorn protease